MTDGSRGGMSIDRTGSSEESKGFPMTVRKTYALLFAKERQ